MSSVIKVENLSKQYRLGAVSTRVLCIRSQPGMARRQSDDATFECRHLMKKIEANPAYKLVVKNPNYLFKKIV